MRIKITQFTIICLASLLIVACGNSGGPNPKQVLTNYLNSLNKSKYKEAYSYISSEDKAVKDLQSYLNDKNNNNPFTQAINSKTSYKIKKIDKSGRNATADVEITQPDLGSIFSNVMGLAITSAFDSTNKKKMEKKLAQKFESGKIPMSNKEKTFHLVDEKDGWKMFFDWKRQAKIQQLLAEAKKLKESKKLYGAVKKYEQILELDSDMVDVKKSLEKTKEEIKSFEEKQKYIKNVELYDLKAKYYKTYLDGKVPGVTFKLRNKGNKTLKEVEVTVYFKDANDTTIAEEKYYPVLVTKYSFGDNNKPLKPNYIWQMKRDEFYKAESVPSEWKVGKVSAKITDIEFE
ncbi:MAG TPA: hypothetical protein VKA34_18955 [Balneolales bacterium]|nr:hypothetical protein [Balneolales bacterium]